MINHSLAVGVDVPPEKCASPAHGEGPTKWEGLFRTDNADAMVQKVKDAGYEVFIEPNDIVIRSEPEFHARMAFCYGPLGEQIEFFQEQ